MLNGEETVIGGMFINQTTKVRTGIPFLKDLPWWFFGLRYIFGTDQDLVTKKELVILLRAELVPTLKERLAGPQSVSPLKDELEKRREKIKLYQFNQEKSENNEN
jgi:type IV pilus assembly protein PilQ